MRYARVFAELIHLFAGLVATQLVFAAAVWAYPQGRDTIEPIGWLTTFAVLAMSVPEMIKAWRADNRKNDLA